MTDTPESSTRPAPASSGSPAAPGGGSNGFFAAIRSTAIVRGSDRWLAGVCGGIALRAGLNPTSVRVLTIVVGILGGPVLFAYAVGWALLPDATGRIHAEQAVRGVFDPAMIGIIALVAISIASYTRSLWWQNPAAGLPDWLATTLAVGWSVGVSIGIVWLVVFLARRTAAPVAGYPVSAAAPDREPANGGVAGGPPPATTAAPVPASARSFSGWRCSRAPWPPECGRAAIGRMPRCWSAWP